jgi:hypothetical protein
MSVLFRFFVVLFAYWLATIAAGMVLVLGAVSPGLSTPPSGSEEWPVIWFLVIATSMVVGVVAFVPSVIAILLTEAFGWRWLVLYALAGAAIGLFSASSAGFIEWRPDIELPRMANTELMAAAGIAAGFVYWLIAGRRAGAWRDI